VTARQIGLVVLWMGGVLLSFSALAISIRLLAGGLSVFEILAVRSLGSVVILLALCILKPELRKGLAPRRFGLNLLRNAVHFAATYSWALAITLLPFATVFALEFTMPAWAALLALMILGERVTAGRVAVVVTCFLGVLVILRPGLEAFRPAALLVLGAAFGYAVFNIITKKLTATESPFAIVLWMNVMQLPMGLAGSDPAFLTKIGAAQILPVAAIGIAGLSAHYCLANAFRAGDATFVLPIDFARLPLIALIGWLFFGEALDAFTFIGAAIILCGIFWNVRSETRKG
jgi:drug/metabolite transporter (DMT)-like permease